MAGNPSSYRPTNPLRPKGFTLLELLVVIAVVALLVATLLPALAGARKAAARVRELSAAQQLMTAYTLYSDDNRGRVLPGYVPAVWVSDPPLPGAPQVAVYDDQQERIYGVRAQRYPWRLAPYLDYDLGGLYKDENLLARYRSRSDFQYVVSLSPSLGVNAEFVGGRASPGYGFDGAAQRAWGSFYVTRTDQPVRPDHLVVFASARGVDPDGSDPVPGYFEVNAPYLTARRWTARYSENDPPAAAGQVHVRHDGKAVTACFDGHGQSLSFSELEDMRRWSNQADRADWTLRVP
jgi:prepilin-type N-terminal cleavage/methylation domain-containing protein